MAFLFTENCVKLILLICVCISMTFAQKLTGSIEKDTKILREARSRGWLVRSDSPKVTSSDSGDRRKGDFRYYWSKLRHGSIEVEPVGSGLKSYFENQDFTFTPNNPEASSVVTISATGDVMFQNSIAKDESLKLYGSVAPFLFGADYVTGNLESPLNFDKRNRGFPRFNLDKTMFEKLTRDGKGNRFDLVATANNHLLDGGIEGLVRTKEILDSCGIKSVGTARSADEQNSFPIETIKGIKTAFLAYSFGSNRIASPEESFYCNILKLNDIEPDSQDFSLIFDQIDSAKARGAEVIWVNLHWGAEWELYPPVRNVALAHRLAERGATVIIGHHPHCLQPMERFITADGRETFIAYSLGNITFNYHWIEPAKTGGVVNVDLVRTESGSVAINGVRFMPTYHQMKVALGDGVFGLNSKIWPLDEAILTLQTQQNDSPFNRRNQKEILLYAHQVHSIIFGKHAKTVVVEPTMFTNVESVLYGDDPAASNNLRENSVE